ncbi:hypothetical protein LT330_006819 [Penicillium expansum]|nr:hypothetical protein LT330_006819 [Penicillium expansum]
MSTETQPEMASTPPEPIAIIGMSCRLSGEASSVDGFWDMLRNGRTGHGRVPSSRYEASAWYHPNQDRKGGINHDSGFFLEEDPSRFDAPFFSITAKEAAGMDPTQRLLLEVAYETFENSGVPMESLPGSRTGVFTGCMTNDYELLSTGDLYNMPHNAATGNARAMLANRLSWFFDLRGPSIMLDTACSSSLTALHLASKSLRDGECEMALVSGASLILHPNFTQRLSSMHMLSPDGISHSFDASANGYGRGEGFAAVLLKPLRTALADNDAIRAIIRATGINQDGRTPGITMPSRQAQAGLIRALYGPGLPSLQETAFFEAHGTGTKVGDPTELAAIGECLMGAETSTNDRLYVGSVKGNIGHTEGAAGVASLIKVVLCLENDMLVPNAGFSKLNSNIHLDKWLLRLSDKTIRWPSHLPRRASINSFGFGGSNAHAIVESASTYLERPAALLSGLEKGMPQIVVFSTHDKTGIDRVAAKWGPFLQAQIDAEQNISFRDIAYTMYARRSQLSFRSFAVAGSLGQLRDALQQGLPHFLRANGTAHANLAFVFTGQGAQWAQMGVELLQVTSFRESITRSEQILSGLGCPWNLFEEIQVEAATSRMNQPDRSQSICCALQIALVNLLASWGVHPKATVGHSSGEIGAAYAAGFITQEDAIRIAYFRGLCSLQVACHGRAGAMLAANLSLPDAQMYLQGVPPRSVVVACVNGPTSVTLSGDADRIDQLEKQLQADGLFARKLRVETAYHSPHMNMVAEGYRHDLQDIQPAKGGESSIAMFSSVTKERVYATDMTADYWVRNLVSPVEFLSAVTSLANMTEASQYRHRAVAVKWSAFLEIGPHEALKGPFLQVLKSINAGLSTVPYHALVRRHADALQTTLNVAGLLWCIGIPIDIEAVNSSINTAVPQLMHNLPSYPWNHQGSFWHEPVASARLRKRREPHHDLLGSPMDFQNDTEPRWRNFLRVSDIPWLADHVVADSILFPAAGMIVMVAEAGRILANTSLRLEGIEFNDLAFLQGLVIPDDDRGVETVLHVAPYHELAEWYEFTLFSLPEDGPWVRHATGTFTLHYDARGVPLNVEEWGLSVERFRKIQTAECETNRDAVYEWLSQTGGVTMGPSFQSVSRAAFCTEENRLWIEGEVTDTRTMMPSEYASPCFIHPTSLDTLFQAAVLSCSDALGNQNAKIPVGVDRLYLSTTWDLQQGDYFSVHTETCLNDGDSRLDSIASDVSWSQPRVVLKGVRLGPVPMSKVPSTSTTAGVDSGTSRFSSIVWAQHLESPTSPALAGHDRDGQLTDWVRDICYTYGNACALVVTQPSWKSPAMTSIQTVRPQLGSRPCLQGLTIVIVGLDKAADEFATAVTRLMPGAQVKQIAALQDFSPSTFNESFFDVVLVDQPCIGNAADADVLLTSLSSTTKQDGVLAVRTYDSQLDPMDYIQRSSEWKVSGRIRDGDFLLAHRQRIPAPLDSTIFVLMPDTEQIPPTFRVALERALSAVGVKLCPVDVEDINGLAGKMVISLLEFRHPWTSKWTSVAMAQFKMLLEARYILWVSPIPILSKDASAASFGASTGLLRTLRNEQPGVTLPQVQYDPDDPNSETSLAQGILQVIQLTLVPVPHRNHDMEYRLQHGRLLVPRVVSEAVVDDKMQTLLHGPRPILARLADDPRALRFHVGSPDGHGGQWVDDRQLVSDVPDDHVEVQLSLRSVVARGSRNFNAHESRLSVVEAVGVIRKLGFAGSTDLSVGDIVVLLVPGAGTVDGMSNRIQVSSKAVAKLPAQLTLAQAVTVPLAYILAYTSLFDIARLGPNCTVLLVGPVGPILRALLSCALEIRGMQVYVATEERAVVEELVAQYAIAPEYALSIHGGLDGRIADLTEGQGVTAVLSCLGGSSGRLAARCLGSGGHYVDLTGEMNLAALPKAVVSQGCTFTSVNLNSMLQNQSEKVYSSFRRAVATIGLHHQIQPTSIFPISKWAEAESLARQTGISVAIDFTDPGQVPVVPALQEPVNLPPQQTYLLAGGLGMIGLGFAKTLVDSGARHLVILSRSGVLQPSQRIAVASLADQGCHVEIIRCDISQEADLQQVLSQVRSQNWQLKGIIQCATVLKDAAFHTMTFEDWASSTNPKILGTLNLHKVFVNVDLDFFITLSSVSGLIGNIGQANYAAGNVFMDELMIWRRAHGLPGHSIDIGLVPDASGMSDMAETAEVRRSRYSHLEGTEITLRELQMLLRVIILGDIPVPVQIIAGITDDLPREGASSWQYDRKLDHRVRLGHSEPDNMPAQISELLKSSPTIEDASYVVNQALREYLASAMATTADTIDSDLPLSSLGVDSLKVTEVQNWVSRKMGAQLSSFDFLGMQPLRVLSEKIAAQSAFVTVS